MHPKETGLIIQAPKCPSNSEKHASENGVGSETEENQQPLRTPHLGPGCPVNPGEDKVKDDRALVAVAGFLRGGEKGGQTHSPLPLHQ